MFGPHPATENIEFNDFIEKFEDNLNERRIKGEERWFEENLKQVQLFGNMEDLAERIGSIDPFIFLIDNSYSYPELEGRTPLRPEVYYVFFIAKEQYAYVYLDEEDTCEFRMSSIFNLLGLNDPFRYLLNIYF